VPPSPQQLLPAATLGELLPSIRLRFKVNPISDPNPNPGVEVMVTCPPPVTSASSSVLFINILLPNKLTFWHAAALLCSGNFSHSRGNVPQRGGADVVNVTLPPGSVSEALAGTTRPSWSWTTPTGRPAPAARSPRCPQSRRCYGAQKIITRDSSISI